MTTREIVAMFKAMYDADIGNADFQSHRVAVDASKKWTLPTRNWKSARNRFMIEIEDRSGRFYLNRTVTQKYIQGRQICYIVWISSLEFLAIKLVGIFG